MRFVFWKIKPKANGCVERKEFMDYFYLVLLSCAIAGQSVIGGFYKQKSASPFVYQMAISVAAFLFFFIGAKCRIIIDRELLLYGSIYGISYSRQAYGYHRP